MDKDKDKDWTRKDKDKDWSLVLKKSLRIRTRTRINITGIWVDWVPIHKKGSPCWYKDALTFDLEWRPWPWMTFNGHFKVTKVKITRSGQTGARRPVPITNKKHCTRWDEGKRCCSRLTDDEHWAVLRTKMHKIPPVWYATAWRLLGLGRWCTESLLIWSY